MTRTCGPLCWQDALRTESTLESLCRPPSIRSPCRCLQVPGFRMWIAGFLSLEPAAAKSLVLSGSFIRFHESCSSTKRSGTTAEGFAQIMCLYKLLQLALSFAVAVAMALTITDKTLPSGVGYICWSGTESPQPGRCNAIETAVHAGASISQPLLSAGSLARKLSFRILQLPIPPALKGTSDGATAPAQPKAPGEHLAMCRTVSSSTWMLDRWVTRLSDQVSTMP